MLSHKPQIFRQEPAQNGAKYPALLVDCATSGSVVSASGKIYPTPFADQPIPATSLVGRAGVSDTSLPDFFRVATRKPLNRQGFAQTRLGCEFFLRDRTDGRFVRLSTNNKNQGWTVCGQENFTPHWRFWRALRPAVQQPVNRHFMARGRACLARFSLMAIRCWGPLRGLVVTTCIARQIRANAARPLTGQSFSATRSLTGPDHNARRAAAGLPAPGGALRFHAFRSPFFNAEDTPCSKRS